MKKCRLMLALLGAVVLLSSCSMGRFVNNTTNANLTQTQVVLSQKNYKVVKTVQTMVNCKNTSVLGFIQIFNNRKDLYNTAYSALIKEANLTGSQALINVSIERASELDHFLPLFTHTEDAYIATGVVIEFTE